MLHTLKHFVCFLGMCACAFVCDMFQDVAGLLKVNNSHHLLKFIRGETNIRAISKMDNRVNTIRCGLQRYWASNQVLQQLIPLEKVAEDELAISHVPTLRTIMEDFHTQSLPAGPSQKEVLCITTLFRWWSFRVGQVSNHKLANERINQVRASYSAIPVELFARINTELNKYARETKWVPGLPVIEMSADDTNNKELQGSGGRQRKRNLAGDEDVDGIPGRKTPVTAVFHLKQHLKISVVYRFVWSSFNK